MGRTMHVVHQIESSSLSMQLPDIDRQDRFHYLKRIVQCQPVSVNICIFVERISQIDQIIQLLKKHDLIARPDDKSSLKPQKPRRLLNLITSDTNESDVEKIVKRWTSRTGNESVGLILILEQAACDSELVCQIDTAHCCINFNMPRNPAQFAKRMWFMRRYFFANSLYQADDTKKEPAIAASTSNLTSIRGNKAELRELSRSNAELDVQHPVKRIDYMNNVKHSICSYLFYKNANTGFVDFLYNFLTRVGVERRFMPDRFLTVVEQVREMKERERLIQSKEELTAVQICPFIKSLGKCMNPIPGSCFFRHTMSPDVDKMRVLDNTDGKEMTVPNEGMIKVVDFSFIFSNRLIYFRF